jgi:hypothetical protein
VSHSAERTFLRYARTTREALRSRPRLAQDDEAGWARLHHSRELPSRLQDRVEVRCRPDEEKGAATRPNERKAPLRGHGRCREGSGNRGSVVVPARASRVSLGARADDRQVPEPGRDAFEERALAAIRLEEDEVEVGPRRCERDPRRAAPRPDVHDRAFTEKVGRFERAVEERAPGFRLVADRGQTGRLEERREPAVEPLVRQD